MTHLVYGSFRVKAVRGESDGPGWSLDSPVKLDEDMKVALIHEIWGLDFFHAEREQQSILQIRVY